jgi:hypothetical protein
MTTMTCTLGVWVIQSVLTGQFEVTQLEALPGEYEMHYRFR